jgi:hypothetical protein
VWRYLTLGAVIATIKKRKLRLTRVDKFQDRFEGSVPKNQIDAQTAALIGAASRQAMLDSVAAHYPGMGRSMPPEEDPEPESGRPARKREQILGRQNAGPARACRQRTLNARGVHLVRDTGPAPADQIRVRHGLCILQ